MAILLIDAGNTRIKWRLHDAALRPAAAAWSDADAASQGTIGIASAARLAEHWRDLDFTRALIACVADDAVFAAAEAALRQSGRTVALERLVPRTRQCGLVNAYPQPAQLGADRWAAALGAHGLHPDRVLLVASLGTATTLDLVLPAGEEPGGTAHFAGGVILPGIELMRAALARGTARLPLAAGAYHEIADNTDDAITSGIVHAQLGALERLCRRARAEAATRTPQRAALCLIGGGAATHLHTQLADAELRARLGVEIGSGEQLVLRGLARIASGESEHCG